MFESIGILASVLLLGYLYLSHIQSNEYEKIENRQLAKYNEKCRELEYKSIKNSLNIDLDKEFKKIFNDPSIRNLAIQKKNIAEEESRQFDEESKNERKERRKLAYKYENNIFSIFDCNRFLERNDLLEKIQYSYGVSKKESENIFTIWEKNYLIGTQSHEHLNMYEIGYILTRDYCKLTPSDLTRDEWLLLNNKKLVDNSSLTNENNSTCCIKKKNMFEMNSLNFIETFTIKQFLEKMGVSRIQIMNDPETGELYFTFGSERGAVSSKGIPEKPVVSYVTNESGVSLWLLHEEGQGAPTILPF